MCGRYVAPDERAIEQYFELRKEHPFQGELFNAAPSLALPVVLSVYGKLAAEPMQWCFVPFWWTKDELPNSTINARAEDAADKPMWRDAVKYGRALVPALGYYEWRPHAN